MRKERKERDERNMFYSVGVCDINRKEPSVKLKQE
jgi:hypothetical protein